MSPRTSAAADPDALRHARACALTELREARWRPFVTALRVVVFGVALPLSLLGGVYATWHWSTARDGGLEEGRRAFARSVLEAARPQLEACLEVDGVRRPPFEVVVFAHGAGAHLSTLRPTSPPVEACFDDVMQRIALVALRYPTHLVLTLQPRDDALVRVTGVRGPLALTPRERTVFYQTVREVGSCAALRGVTSRFVLSTTAQGVGVSHPSVRDCLQLPTFAPALTMPYMWWVDPALTPTAPLRYDVSAGVRLPGA
jgi:hypothetical protein